MRAVELVTLNMRELDRLKVIQAVVQHRLTIVLAAERLQLCERQVSRLVRRYEAAGPAGLVSARRGQPSNHELPVDLRARAMALVRERYADFGPTLACEKLRECHDIHLAKETVRHLMTGAGLWIPRRQRLPKVYQPRARRGCLGELERLLAALVEEYIFAQLCEALMLSFAAENETRMRAMVAARTHVHDTLESLIGESRRLRQDEIASEIVELSSVTLAATTPPRKFIGIARLSGAERSPAG